MDTLQKEILMLDEIKSRCADCTMCDLYKGKHNTVFGCGNEHADIMFIGEAPGECEDNEGIPFVGKAGQLLDRYLFAADIKREDVYITNIIKCRPPSNRDPLPEEQDACMRYLREQVKCIYPSIIVCLGRISACRLISPDLKITKDHGVWFERGKYSLIALYHPSALLRDHTKRADMLDDIRKVKKKYDELCKNK